jgi:hypothetical protein
MEKCFTKSDVSYGVESDLSSRSQVVNWDWDFRCACACSLVFYEICRPALKRITYEGMGGLLNILVGGEERERYM